MKEKILTDETINIAWLTIVIIVLIIWVCIAGADNENKSQIIQRYQYISQKIPKINDDEVRFYNEVTSALSNEEMKDNVKKIKEDLLKIQRDIRDIKEIMKGKG